MPRPTSEYVKSSVLSVFVIVVSLYLARRIVILVALAVLFAFLLEPMARRFERLRIGRIGAAVGAVFVAMVIFCLGAELVVDQLGELGRRLPDYKSAWHEKLRRMESGYGGLFGRTAKSIQDFQKDLIPTNLPAETGPLLAKTAKPVEAKPVPVEIRNPDVSPAEIIEMVLGPLVNVLTTLFVVTICCIFILAGREDLRSRLVRITGARNSRLMNLLLDETGRRVSRYLLMQLAVNVGYGVPIGLGLWLIGIPNPLLWGMVAALFRYIPYVGAWIAAALPLAVALASGAGWARPLLVLALFGVVEILTANVVEPLLYGRSTGITPLAVLLSAIFWAWIWGPVGLLLSMPLTVCLVSISRYVPQMDLLVQLFGEAEAVPRVARKRRSAATAATGPLDRLAARQTVS